MLGKCIGVGGEKREGKGEKKMRFQGKGTKLWIIWAMCLMQRWGED